MKKNKTMGKGGIHSCEGHFPSPHPFPLATLKTFERGNLLVNNIKSPIQMSLTAICIGLLVFDGRC